MNGVYGFGTGTGVPRLANGDTLKDLRVLDTKIDGSGQIRVPFSKTRPTFQLSSLHLRFHPAPPQTENCEFLRELVVMGNWEEWGHESYESLLET